MWQRKKERKSPQNRETVLVFVSLKFIVTVKLVSLTWTCVSGLKF